MKNSVWIILLVVLSISMLNSQQRVDYEITAELDTLKHIITAEQIINYNNNSGEELNEIYVHLWANAFRSKTGSFADKMIRSGNPDLYYLKSDEMGGYRELSFSQDNKNLAIAPVDKDEEIIIVKLSEPIKPGTSAKIKVNYTLKIPKDILGFGFSDNFHIISNWYPKVAVYENKQWKYHSFNSSNLLYSDFGNYSVTMIVPCSHTLISSGKEKEFPVNTEFKGNHIEGDSSYRKAQYIAENVQDFSWILSRTYLKKSRLQTLNLDKNIALYIYFPDDTIIKQRFTVITNALTNSMVFLDKNMKSGIPEKLNIVIVKGINKPSAFQDIITLNLSSFRKNIKDERDLMMRNIMKQNIQNSLSLNAPEYPWLVEGMSSYYRTRFLTSDLIDKSEENESLMTIQDKIEEIIGECVYKTTSLNIDMYWNDRLIDHFLDYQTDINMNYMASRTGEKLFDTTMFNFFEKYKKTRVTPEIFRSFLDQNLNKDHTWFFDEVMQNRDAFSYRIKSVKKQGNLKKIKVLNQGPFAVPYRMDLFKGDSVINTLDVPGHTGMKEFTFDIPGGDKIEIDHENTILKSRNSKTKYFIKNRFKNLELFNFFRENGPTNTIYPMTGYNKHDEFLIGTYISRVNDRKINGKIYAFYGTGAKSMVGDFGLYYNTLDCCSDNFLSFYLTGATYHKNKGKDFNLRYYRISPNIIYLYHTTDYRYNLIQYTFDLIHDQAVGSEGVESYFRYQNQLSFNYQGGNVILPFSVNAELEHQYYNYFKKRQYLMINSELNSWFMYKKDRYLKFRVYGATYLFNTDFNSTGTQPGTLSLIGYNKNDYSYRNNRFFDRSAQEGFGVRQLITTTGGFKTGISNSYGIGQSNKYVASVNFRMDLPFGTIVKPFFDIGVYGDLPTVSEGYSNKIIYSGGFLIETPFIEIYFPFFNSKTIEDIYKENKSPFWSKFSFSINLNDRNIVNAKY